MYIGSPKAGGRGGETKNQTEVQLKNYKSYYQLETVRGQSRSLTGKAEEVMTHEMQRASDCRGLAGDQGCPHGAEVHCFLQQNRQEDKPLYVKSNLQYSYLCHTCLVLHEE